jgi:hypothetical protein
MRILSLKSEHYYAHGTLECEEQLFIHAHQLRLQAHTCTERACRVYLKENLLLSNFNSKV